MDNISVNVHIDHDTTSFPARSIVSSRASSIAPRGRAHRHHRQSEIHEDHHHHREHGQHPTVDDNADPPPPPQSPVPEPQVAADAQDPPDNQNQEQGEEQEEPPEPTPMNAIFDNPFRARQEMLYCADGTPWHPNCGKEPAPKDFGPGLSQGQLQALAQMSPCVRMQPHYQIPVGDRMQHGWMANQWGMQGGGYGGGYAGGYAGGYMRGYGYAWRGW